MRLIRLMAHCVEGRSEMIGTLQHVPRREFAKPHFAVVFAIVLGSCLQARATVVDLTSTGASGEVGGARFIQFDSPHFAGSSRIDSFLQIQGSESGGIEAGYNTTGTLEYDTKQADSLLLSAVPTVTLDSVEYREFMLDTNEASGDKSGLSLDELKLYVESTGDRSGHPANFSAPVYDMDAVEDSWVLLDSDLSSGMGNGDLLVYIPSSMFGSDEAQHVYLYSRFGDTVTSEDGVEEWYVGIGGAIVPEPGALALLALGAALCVLRRNILRHHESPCRCCLPASFSSARCCASI